VKSEVKVWEDLELDDAKNFENLYQDLCVYKYATYLEDFREVIRKKFIVRVVEGHFVNIHYGNRKVSFCFEFEDGSTTEQVYSIKVPTVWLSRSARNEIVKFFAKVETNARVNFPQSAADFAPLEMPEVFFAN
jgi:hypothetical protein